MINNGHCLLPPTKMGIALVADSPKLRISYSAAELKLPSINEKTSHNFVSGHPDGTKYQATTEVFTAV